jgi:hypothetical protein
MSLTPRPLPLCRLSAQNVNATTREDHYENSPHFLVHNHPGGNRRPRMRRLRFRIRFRLGFNGGRSAERFGDRSQHGSTDFTLTVNGSGFVTGSVIYWSSTAHMTQVVTNSQLTTLVSAAEVATAGTVPIHVSNPGGTGIYMSQPAQSSNTVNFMVQ